MQNADTHIIMTYKNRAFLPTAEKAERMCGMELFEKLSDTIVSVSKDATQKAKDISEQARIRVEIRSKKDYRNKLLQEIGRLYYEEHMYDEEPEFEDQVMLLKEVEETLDELKAKLGQIKGTVKCKNCGKDMPLDADFCSKCGTKLEKKEAKCDCWDAETEEVETEDAESEVSPEEALAEEVQKITEEACNTGK